MEPLKFTKLLGSWKFLKLETQRTLRPIGLGTPKRHPGLVLVRMQKWNRPVRGDISKAHPAALYNW